MVDSYFKSGLKQ